VRNRARSRRSGKCAAGIPLGRAARWRAGKEFTGGIVHAMQEASLAPR
jgi:hypothetical protein